VTLIKGENDTGKSSILKSLYSAFGAVPAVEHPKWKAAKVQILVHFEVDGIRYSILRNGNFFTVFDARERVLLATTSVTRDLGPFLADLLDFRLRLPDRQGRPTTPPPAFMFIPYYIDQDRGWNENWTSFGRMAQFSNWRVDLVEYHTGVRPNEYYIAKAEVRELKERRAQPEREATALRAVEARLAKTAVVEFSLDVDEYKEQIRELVERCGALQQREDELREKTSSLNSERVRVISQIDIVKRVARELDHDFDYANEQLAHDHVDCPTCGASYPNEFAERFGIAKDQGRCAEFLGELAGQLAEVERKIQDANRTLTEASSERTAVNDMLAAKQGDVSLHDLIRTEGKKELRSIVSTDLSALFEQIASIDKRSSALGADLGAFEDSARRSKIEDSYQAYMRTFLHELDVKTLDPRAYARISARIHETGSDLPRAILAYTFSILRVMSEYGSAASCPLVIDSPKQQDLDDPNYRRMLKFIRERLPTQQLILALVNDLDVGLGDAVIDFADQKYGALRAGEYQPVSAVVKRFVDRSLSLE